MPKLISTNPALNYQKIDSVDISTKAEIKQKVLAAKKATSLWKETPLSQRIKYFKNLINIYQNYKLEMAELVSKEMGKPITESLEDVEFDLNSVKSKIKLAKECLAPVILDESETQKNVLYHEPLGVVAVIVPWNFPSSNFFISCNQVLLAGNVVVFKHSEETPLVGQLIEKIMREAGFPEGVFSVVHGDGKVGDILTDQDIDAIHFTGSSKVGQYLYQKAAHKFIPVILEMGGSSPGIVFADADLKSATQQIIIERFMNCGQVCNALKRLIVHEKIFNQIVAVLKKQLESMKIGDPLDKTTQIGPLVAKRQLDLLIEQVDDAKAKGAQVITGGDVVKGLKGAYYQPTILTNVSMDMRVMTEEVFGPVLPIIKFKTEQEAIKLANQTIYGLSAYLYGGKIKQLKKAAAKIDAGQISLNGASYFTQHAPFGGYKLSGLGRNDGYLGFDQATQKKVIAEPK